MERDDRRAGAGLGGPLLSPESIAPGATAADRRLVGSGMIYEAASLEAVRKVLEADIYYTSGVVSPRPSPRPWVSAALLTPPDVLRSGMRRSS